MDQSRYDVIIIGTGAGGGTLAHRLAPSGKRILLLERGDYVPREKDNWSTRAVNVEGKYQTKESWRDRDGQGAASPHQLLGRRQHQVLRRGAVPAAAGGLRRAAPPRRHLARLAHRLRRAGAVLHRGRAPLPGARRARGGPHRAAGERALPLPRREPRAPDPAAERRLRPARAAARSTCRSASCWTSGTARQSRCIRCGTCDGHPCLVSRQVRRPGGLRGSGARVPERHPAHRRLRLPAGDRAPRGAR